MYLIYFLGLVVLVLVWKVRDFLKPLHSLKKINFAKRYYERIFQIYPLRMK